MDNDKIPLAIFLDLSKAFDTLDHKILLAKLNHHGVRGLALQLLQSYLTDRNQYIDLDHISSDLSLIKTAVLQGSILGTLVFIAHINDIARASSFFKMILYADDTILVASLEKKQLINKLILENILNCELEKVNAWFQANYLHLNMEKSKYMLFYKPPRRVIVPVLQLNNTKLIYVEEDL